MNALRLSGCGTQHPLRALGGTCVLLAAAPTTPPCFRHWRRSSSLLRINSGKIIFNRAMPERLRTLRHCIFTGRGRKGKRQLPELPQSKPDGFASSLEEGASGAPANFALEPETVPLCQRPHLRGGWHRVAMTGGVFPHTFFLHISPAFRPNY